MDEFFLTDTDRLNTKTLRILPADCPLGLTVREVLSPRFAIVGGAAALTVICGGDVPVPPRGAVIVIADRDEDCGRVIYMSRPLDLEALSHVALALTEPLAAAAPSGAYRVNTLTRTVAFGGREAVLTGKEFALFSLLNRTPGVLVRKSEVCAALWGGKSVGACDVYVCYLRRKLEAVAGHGALLSVRGKGYILCSPGGETERNLQN